MAPPTQRAWSGFGPTPFEVYRKLVDAGMNPSEALAASQQELQNLQPEYQRFINAGIDPNVYRQHPTATAAMELISRPIRGIVNTLPGQVVEQASARYTGASPAESTGIPVADNAAGVLAAAANLVPFAFAAGVTRGMPMQAAAQVLPRRVATPALGAAQGLLATGVQAASQARVPTAAEMAQNAAFGAGAAVGGQVARNVMGVRKIAPLAKTLIEDVGAGLGGAIAGAPISLAQGQTLSDYLKGMVTDTATDLGVDLLAASIFHTGLAKANLSVDQTTKARVKRPLQTLAEAQKAVQTGQPTAGLEKRYLAETSAISTTPEAQQAFREAWEQAIITFQPTNTINAKDVQKRLGVDTQQANAIVDTLAQSNVIRQTKVGNKAAWVFTDQPRNQAAQDSNLLSVVERLGTDRPVTAERIQTELGVSPVEAQSTIDNLAREGFVQQQGSEYHWQQGEAKLPGPPAGHGDERLLSIVERLGQQGDVTVGRLQSELGMGYQEAKRTVDDLVSEGFLRPNKGKYRWVTAQEPVQPAVQPKQEPEPLTREEIRWLAPVLPGQSPQARQAILQKRRELGPPIDTTQVPDEFRTVEVPERGKVEVKYRGDIDRARNLLLDEELDNMVSELKQSSLSSGGVYKDESGVAIGGFYGEVSTKPDWARSEKGKPDDLIKSIESKKGPVYERLREVARARLDGEVSRGDFEGDAIGSQWTSLNVMQGFAAGQNRRVERVEAPTEQPQIEPVQADEPKIIEKQQNEGYSFGDPVIWNRRGKQVKATITQVNSAGVMLKVEENGKTRLLPATYDQIKSVYQQQGPQPIEKPRGGTAANASGGGYAPTATVSPAPQQNKAVPIEMPELVELAKELNQGKTPTIKKQIRSLQGTARGVFKHQGTNAEIELRADIFLGDEIQAFQGREKTAAERKLAADKLRQDVATQNGVPVDSIVVRHEKGKNGKTIYRAYNVDATLAPKVLAHEIGHMDDWLPDHDMSRGNILGHVAVLKRYMNSTISELPTTPDEFLTGQERIAIRKQAVKDSNRNTALQEVLYQQYLKDELTKRGLATKDEIMDELKTLTQAWKPFDDSAGMSDPYVKYRYSAKELYADAVSVIYNDSTLAKQLAPRFTSMFEQYMVRKPEVKAAYDAIQNRYADREAVNDNRIDTIYGMFERGNETREAAEERGKRKTVGILDTLMAGLVDKQHAMLKGIRQREKGNGVVAQEARDARLGLEEAQHISSAINDYFYKIDNTVTKPMEDAGVTNADFGAYIFLKRIGADRSQYANPLGHTENSAKETLDALRSRLGDAKFKAIESMAEQYRNLREKYVFPQVEDAGIYSPELMQTIKDSKDYGKFSVQKYLEDKFGGQVTAAVHKQIGTLNEIENPFIATVLQDVSMLRAAKLNKTKSDLITDLKNAGQISNADLVYSQDVQGQMPKAPKDPELSVLTVMENGKPAHYYVDREIAKSFEYEPSKANMAAQAWGVANGVLRDVLVSKNPKWQIRNIIRDFKGTFKNVDQIEGIRDLPKLLGAYRSAVREVYNEVFREIRSKDISDAMQEFAIPTNRTYSRQDVKYDDAVEKLTTEFLNKVQPEPPVNIGLVRKLYELLEKTGRVSEMTSKVAGYKYLKENAPNLSERERAHIVRNRVGTPDYTRRGKWNTVTNNVFMFSNVNKEGLRNAVESYKANPARYVWKTTMMNVVPKLILAGVGAWGTDTLVGQTVEKADEYDKRMYNVVPIGLINGGKDAIYLRIPQDYEGQAIGAAIWDVLHGKIGGKEGLISTIAGQNPYNLHPLLDVAYKGYQIAALGINPVDEYRGSSVISDQGWEAGGKEVAKEYAAYAWNNLGGSNVYQAKSGVDIITDESELQKLLRGPGGNILGAFLRVSHNGETSKIYGIRAQIQKEAAQRSIRKKNEAIKAINQGMTLQQTYATLVSKGLIDPEQTSVNQYRSTYEKLQSRSSDSPWDSAIAYASSVAERKALFEQMPDEEKARFSGEYNTQTGEKYSSRTRSKGLL